MTNTVMSGRENRAVPGRVERIVLWVCFALMILANVLFELLPLNGVTSADVSNSRFVLFTPAGYVFSIWTLIYVLLAAWLVRFTFSQRFEHNEGITVGKPASGNVEAMMVGEGFGSSFTILGVFFMLTCICNALWLVTWHYELFSASVIVMLLLLATLIGIYVITKRSSNSILEWLPFSVYLGWISVATIANISFALSAAGFEASDLVQTIGTIFLLLFATVLAFVMRHRENDRAFPLVFVWAFIGIGVRLYDFVPTVAIVAYMLAGVVVLFTALPIVRRANVASSGRGRAVSPR